MLDNFMLEGLNDKVSGWGVSKEPTLPDHRHIMFNLESAYGEKKWIKNSFSGDLEG